MGGLRRKPIPPDTDDEVVRALARSSAPFSRHVRHFRHAGKSFIAYEGGVPTLKAHLRRLLRRRSNHLRAEALTVEGSGQRLMAVVEQHDLEGIVAKRKSDPYRSGVHWWKIKNPAYSQTEGRHELFNLAGRAIPMSAIGEKPHHQGG
jgi:hypothetical protein